PVGALRRDTGIADQDLRAPPSLVDCVEEAPDCGRRPETDATGEHPVVAELPFQVHPRLLQELCMRSEERDAITLLQKSPDRGEANPATASGNDRDCSCLAVLHAAWSIAANRDRGGCASGSVMTSMRNGRFVSIATLM